MKKKRLGSAAPHHCFAAPTFFLLPPAWPMGRCTQRVRVWPANKSPAAHAAFKGGGGCCDSCARSRPPPACQPVGGTVEPWLPRPPHCCCPPLRRPTTLPSVAMCCCPSAACASAATPLQSLGSLLEFERRSAPSAGRYAAVNRSTAFYLSLSSRTFSSHPTPPPALQPQDQRAVTRASHC